MKNGTNTPYPYNQTVKRFQCLIDTNMVYNKCFSPEKVICIDHLNLIYKNICHNE